MTVVYKNNLSKIRLIQVLENFCGYFGPRNYVSMRKSGTCCIAQKLCRAHFEGSIIPRGALQSL